MNFKGREREGILQEGIEAERVRNAIQSGLAGIADPKTQKTAIRSVLRKEELYSGPYAASAPDLLVNFCPAFRVSWQSAVGGFVGSLIENNMRKWSGDHIIDPESVPGILFMNRPVGANDCSIVDLAPTILNYFDIPVGAAMEGKSLV